MKLVVIIALAVVLLIPTTIFAQEQNSITVTTDKARYLQGETILISGEVSQLEGYVVTISVISPRHELSDLTQVSVGDDGKFSTQIIPDGSLYPVGKYTIRANYGQDNKSIATFEFGNPISKPLEPTYQSIPKPIPELNPEPEELEMPAITIKNKSESIVNSELLTESNSLIHTIEFEENSKVLDLYIDEKEQKIYAFVGTYEKDRWLPQDVESGTNDLIYDNAVSVWIIDTKNDEYNIISKSEYGPYYGFAVDTSNNKFFLFDLFREDIAVFDSITNKKIDTIDLGDHDISGARMDVDESTSRLYFVDGKSTIFVIDTNSLEVIKKIDPHGKLGGVTVNEKLDLAYVVNYPSKDYPEQVSELLAIDENGDIVDRIESYGHYSNRDFPINEITDRIYLSDKENTTFTIGLSEGKHSIIKIESSDSKERYWTSDKAVVSPSDNVLYSKNHPCGIFKINTENDENTVSEQKFQNGRGTCDGMQFELMALDDSNDKLYVNTSPIGTHTSQRSLSVFDVKKMFEPKPNCGSGTIEQNGQCVPKPNVSITSLDDVTDLYNFRILELLQQTTPTSYDEILEFVGEEKRQRYEQTFTEIGDRGISFNSINNIQMSRLSDYEQVVVKDAFVQSVEFLKYKSAEVLYKMDELRDEIIDQIQKSSLPQNEKDSMVNDFEFYTKNKRDEAIRALGMEIVLMQSSLSIQEGGEKIGKDIGNYYNDIKRGDSFSFESIINFESQIDPEPTDFCGKGTIMKNGQCVVDSTSGGGCLIATATYGSELAPQVQLLRELRDNSLLQTESGTNFMNTFNDVYYSFSPIIADYERENPIFKEVVKITLTPLLTSLSILNHVDMDSEESVLVYGISLIILNLGMYFVTPVAIFVAIKKTV